MSDLNAGAQQLNGGAEQVADGNEELAEGIDDAEQRQRAGAGSSGAVRPTSRQNPGYKQLQAALTGVAARDPERRSGSPELRRLRSRSTLESARRDPRRLSAASLRLQAGPRSGAQRAGSTQRPADAGSLTRGPDSDAGRSEHAVTLPAAAALACGATTHGLHRALGALSRGRRTLCRHGHPYVRSRSTPRLIGARADAHRPDPTVWPPTTSVTVALYVGLTAITAGLIAANRTKNRLPVTQGSRR